MVWNLFYSCRIDGLNTGASIKPFDHDSGLNDEEQHSLWRAFAYVSSRLAGGLPRSGTDS
jgi:hypothetical protein